MTVVNKAEDTLSTTQAIAANKHQNDPSEEQRANQDGVTKEEGKNTAPLLKIGVINWYTYNKSFDHWSKWDKENLWKHIKPSVCADVKNGIFEFDLHEKDNMMHYVAFGLENSAAYYYWKDVVKLGCDFVYHLLPSKFNKNAEFDDLSDEQWPSEIPRESNFFIYDSDFYAPYLNEHLPTDSLVGTFIRDWIRFQNEEVEKSKLTKAVTENIYSGQNGHVVDEEDGRPGDEDEESTEEQTVSCGTNNNSCAGNEMSITECLASAHDASDTDDEDDDDDEGYINEEDATQRPRGKADVRPCILS